jgi:hypothetical protein
MGGQTWACAHRDGNAKTSTNRKLNHFYYENGKEDVEEESSFMQIIDRLGCAKKKAFFWFSVSRFFELFNFNEIVITYTRSALWMSEEESEKLSVEC